MTQGHDFTKLMEFLKPFTEGTEGYIAFTKADRSEDPDKNKRWSDFINWYSACEDGEVELEQDALATDPQWEYYFTPAVLHSPRRLQAQFKQSNVIPVDFDEYVDWRNMSPAPSIVVQTSEEKFHCYWLLRDPITDVNDFRYWVKRFMAHFEAGDEAVFDAARLLKLPWGCNLKLGSRRADGTPFQPKILKFNTDLRYSEGSFSHMKEPTITPTKVVEVSEVGDAPETEGNYQDYIRKFSDVLTPEIKLKLYELQDGGEEKRSGALFHLENLLLEVLPTPEDVFRVLKGSPNDKFTADHGASKGAELLWKDINRIIAKTEETVAEDTSIPGQIAAILSGRDAIRDKGIKITEIVLEELLATGTFLHSTDGDVYYTDNRSGVPRLYTVDVLKTSVFAGFISGRFGLNPGTDNSILTGILHEMLYECQRQERITFHHFAHYDIMANKVYVDRYDGTMYVLDGEEVSHQPQGVDGIYFHRTNDALPMPYEYLPDYEPGGFDALVMSGPNYTVHTRNVTEEQIHHILKTWIASIFFPEKMSTKPIVLIHGEPDSGKTTLFQNVSLVLTGDSTYMVTEIPTDPREFNVQVSQNPYIFFDNVNINQKVMQEKLAQAATGFVAKNRTLHTNKEVTNLRARAFIGITSFTLDRIQKDVAQRYLIIPVHPFAADRKHRRKALSSILQEVMDKRDALWSELLDFVNKMVKHIGLHGLETTGSGIRMADYATLLRLTSEMSGLAYEPLERFILGMQAETISENDTMFDAFRSYIATDPDRKIKYTAGQLYDILKRHNRRFASQYTNNRKFATALKAHITSNTLRYAGIGVEIIEYNKSTRYRIFDLELGNLLDRQAEEE